jgi:3-methyladenine DNA glycosylase AlkD
MDDIVNRIRKTLIVTSDKKIRLGSQRIFKEPIMVYGIKTATVKKISKDYFSEVKDRSKMAQRLGISKLLGKNNYVLRKN